MRHAAWLLAPMALAVAVGVQAEDDLALIRKAVSESAPLGIPSAASPAARAAVTPPQWLRVRVEPKGEKKGRVKVNIPLAFVKAVGTELPMSFGAGCRSGRKQAYCGLKLSEILSSLEGGESLVEIDDEEQTVRVWLE